MSEEFNVHGRFGYVSEYDPARHMAKVIFPELDDLVSTWLPVLIPNSLENHDELHLDVNEHVYCLMQGQGCESGIIIGAIYDDTNKPPVGDIEIRSITFKDGTRVSYDRDAHLMKIECTGDIEIEAKGHVKITGSRIDLN